MAVNSSFPAKTVPEFIAHAKANPGKINFASGGIGSLPHVAGELFKSMTGVNLVHVPYRGNYLPDLLAGQVQVAFATLPSAIEFIREGRLRALAVTGAMRSEVLPHVPTVGETVPGYEADGRNGIGAPRNTPVEIINMLNNEINAALADPAMQARLVELGSLSLYRRLQPSSERLSLPKLRSGRKVIRAASIKTGVIRR